MNMTATSFEVALSAFDGTLGASRRLRKPRIVSMICILLLLLLALWTDFATVDQVVRTQGRVVPAGKPQLVQHLEGGIISQVSVREGDLVRQGDTLLMVSALAANATRGERRQRANGLIARVARLQAEAQGAASFRAPVGLPTNAPELLNESAAFSARRAKLQQTIAVLHEQSEQKRHELAEQAAHARALGAEAALSRQQLTMVNQLISRGAASQQELLDAQARLQRLVTQITEAESAAPRLRAAIQELSARSAEIVAQFRSEARTGLSEAEIELRRLQEDMKTDDDRVLRTVVAAPVSGTVNKLNANTVGGVVRPGEVLLELTPDAAAVGVETRASTADRGAMSVGQMALLRVAAYDYTVYGTLRARIAEISADSLLDERGERYFRVGLVVSPEDLKAFGQRISPGMNLTADLITGTRTVAQYLLSPVKGLASTAFRERK